MYHPSKLGKICVVFDCSAEFEGRSINQELLSGPDLTNQVVGVLRCFQQGPVAFMADVESMYYQVMVPDNELAFLIFLWWNSDNLLEKSKDFVMWAHVFGGTSSASCSNYALRRTAVDNESIFGKDASEALQNNFYVNDLLKSSKDVESAKELVKDVMNKCKQRILPHQVHFKQQGVAFVNPRESEKNWCQGSRSIGSTSK